MHVVIVYQHRGDEGYLELIRLAFASARNHDYETFLVGDVELGDTNIRFLRENEPLLMNWVLAAQLLYIESPFFTQDTVLFSPDALINKPLEPVFRQGFDVAVTDRVSKICPINNGVIFIKPENKKRIAAMWRKCLEICKSYPQEKQEWWGDQQSLYDFLQRGYDKEIGVKVKTLPCHTYNASPSNRAEVEEGMLDDAFIIHLKGNRKTLMGEYWKAIWSREYSTKK